MRRLIIISCILVFLASAGGAAFIFAKNRQHSRTDISEAAAASSATITFDGDSFEPELTTIKTGGSIKIVNQSSNDLQFQSDPHPNHSANYELNVGVIDPGVSKTITVHQKGTWGFHNHVASSQHGTIVVK